MFTSQREARMGRFASVAAIVLMWTIVAQGRDTLTGKWQGETTTGTAITLDLVVEGAALTGTLTRDGASIPLAEGKVSKNTFTFKARINEQTEGFSGELAGDQLKVWLDRQGPSRAAVLERVKGQAQERP
jgi:hypothetical protein